MSLLEERVGLPLSDNHSTGVDAALLASTNVMQERPSITTLSTASFIASRLRVLAQTRRATRHATRRATRLRPTMNTAEAPIGFRPGRMAGLVVRNARPFGRASAAQTIHGWSSRPGPRLSLHQREWVSCGGALTAHLSAYGCVSVRVIQESVALPWHDEGGAMRSASDDAMTSSGGGVQRTSPWVWSRDVAISVDGTECVLAHSITPLRASHGPWQAMRRLRTRPLAELLYNDSKVRRSLLVSRYLSASLRRDPLHRLLENAGHALPSSALVARRSVFERHGAPLLITECFLPAFWEMLQHRETLERCAC